MSRAVVLAATTAAMVSALSMSTAPRAEAHKHRYWEGRGAIHYGRPHEGYSGYRPYYGPFYGRPAGIFRPAGIVYRPSHARRSELHCRGWGWVYSRCGKYAKWRCLAW